MDHTPGRDAARPTRQAILGRLKRGGPHDAQSLASALGVSAMAVRQHLYALQAEGLVTYEAEPRPLGRPAKLWRPTPAADRHFPDAHAALAVDLFGDMTATFGQAGVDRLLEARTRRQAAAYRARVPARGSLRRRLDALAAARTAEGYMAEVQPAGGGAFLLIENHCPIAAAATACRGLCGSELQVFREVLGEGVTVERTEHVMAGARRCAYRVSGPPGAPPRERVGQKSSAPTA
jgi:predicted ArsR family transcriptional regulator